MNNILTYDTLHDVYERGYEYAADFFANIYSANRDLGDYALQLQRTGETDRANNIFNRQYLILSDAIGGNLDDPLLTRIQTGPLVSQLRQDIS